MSSIYKKLKSKSTKPLNSNSLGIVYFIGNLDESIIKIGYTTNQNTLKKRLKALQTGNPATLTIFKIIPGTVSLEKAYQRSLYSYSLHGDEWFRLCPYVILFCQLTDIIDINKF